MTNKANPTINESLEIVFLDDNFILRQILKNVLSEILLDADLIINVYTSENGVQGLGYIMLTKPDIVVIDTTLPEYSGRELLEYLSTNPVFSGANRKVLVLSQKGAELKLPPNYILIEKTDKLFLNHFFNTLKTIVSEKGYITKSIYANSLTRFFVGKTIRWANRGDLLMYKRHGNTNIFSRIVMSSLWFISQVVASIYFVFLRFLIGSIKNDQNVSQYSKDLYSFRVRYYPTLVTIIITLLITLLQVILFITGGIVILNTKLESVFSSKQTETKVDFRSSIGLAVELSAQGVLFNPSGASINSKEDVLHASVGGAFRETMVDSHETFVGSFEVEMPTKGLRPNVMLEESSINNRETSLHYGYKYSNKHKIGYLISSDGSTWFYHNGDDWEVTNLGCTVSNSIQEINQYLHSYKPGESLNSLQVKVCLISLDRESSPTLFELILLNQDANQIEQKNKATMSNFQESMAKEVKDYGIFIKSVIYKNNSVIVFGEVRPFDLMILSNLSISESLARDYGVEIYYQNIETDDAVLVATASIEKDDDGRFLVGSKFSWDEVPNGKFFLKMVKKDQSKNVLASSELYEINTIVVDTTNDASDMVLDGKCSSIWNRCSLRAAIKEANDLSSSSIILFNIPVYDSNKIEKGFRDIDRLEVVASGDALWGDDVWIIRLESALPKINDNVYVDGKSQSLFLDTNENGLEVLLDVSDLSVDEGKLHNIGYLNNKK